MTIAKLVPTADCTDTSSIFSVNDFTLIDETVASADGSVNQTDVNLQPGASTWASISDLPATTAINAATFRAHAGLTGWVNDSVTWRLRCIVNGVNHDLTWSGSGDGNGLSTKTVSVTGTEAQLNAATVEIEQTVYSASKGNDGSSFQIDAFEIEVDYTADSSTNVAANTDALILTENQASVAVDVNVNAGVDALTLTENQASVVLAIEIAANTDSLTLTENAATITFDVNVGSNVDALTLSENQASIAFDLNIAASTDALILTENQATVLFGVNIEASSASLTLTENQASVAHDINVSAGVDSLSIATFAADIATSGDTNVAADVASLVLATYQATVDGYRGASGPTQAGTSQQKRKQRRKYIVTVDGNDFVVASQAEAVALLEQAVQLATEHVEKQVSRVQKKKKTRKAVSLPSIKTESEEIAPIVTEYRQRITNIYESMFESIRVIENINIPDDEDEEDSVISLIA